MKALKVIGIILIVLLCAWFLGPQLPEKKIDHQLPEIILDVSNVEDYVAQIEQQHTLRPDNEARIVWANDSLKEKTEFSVLYLHGFSASWYEGYPVNYSMANMLNANLYLSRLAAQGIETPDPLLDMTPYSLYESAKEALLIASALGEKVVIASTSTGGTLALQLAADFPERVHALVLLSPNIAIFNTGAPLLSGPWGLQIAKLLGGSGQYRYIDPGSETEQKYWYKKYRWEGTIYLQQLLDAIVSPKTFAKITQPVFLAYYYKNEQEQDNIVKVSAMLKMFDELGTPEELKIKLALPDAGDHIIGCEETSNSVPELTEAIRGFLHQMIATK
jgi:pimeloyl-ACP methyl ester carboxylesterase